MSEINPNSYPEKKPDIENLQNKEVTDGTLSTLFSAVAELALDGVREFDAQQPIVFQNAMRLADGRMLYMTRYFTANAGEVAVGDKMSDILICDTLPDKKPNSTKGDQPNNYLNYYFINEGNDGPDAQMCHIEKHSFSCMDSELLGLIMNNHRAHDMDYEFERQLGLRTVTESEAIDLLMTIIHVTQQNNHSI
ncbi:MAG: hypothetical protein JWM07_633 [Candidatus Saccharibacteria bacterium]|nr:hypothetical protein [Candidatus Saccharibacteria bacterium]